MSTKSNRTAILSRRFLAEARARGTYPSNPVEVDKERPPRSQIRVIHLTTEGGQVVEVLTREDDGNTVVLSVKPRAPWKRVKSVTKRVSQKTGGQVVKQRDAQYRLVISTVSAPAQMAADQRPRSAAEVALADLRENLSQKGFLNEPKTPEADPWYRGRQQLDAWEKEGVLIPSNQLAKLWHMTRQALESRLNAHKLFGIKVSNRRLYYGRLAELEPDVVAEVSEQLAGMDNMEQLLFWMREHGSLGGHTPVDVLRGQARDGLDAVCALAKSVAERQE